jgi:GNAT superfamily N-acetyltransferase
VEIRRARYDDPAARELTGALAEELLARYDGRPGSGGEPEAADLAPPGGVFLLAVDDEAAVGCGGVCRYEATTGEIRRMYVRPKARGRGIGRLVLASLEAEAKELGYEALRVETGNRQPEAVTLYLSHGFEPIDRYGPYVDDDRSLCFEKRLSRG